jgi:hypothetical protein
MHVDLSFGIFGHNVTSDFLVNQNNHRRFVVANNNPING